MKLAEQLREIAAENIVPTYVYHRLRRAATDGEYSAKFHLEDPAICGRYDSMADSLRREGFQVWVELDTLMVVSWEEE